MPDMKEITVQKLMVPISQPYTEGHICTAAEAKALNQTRSENIGNNLRTAFKAARDGAGNYSDEAKAKLYALVQKRDAEYVFNLASVGGGKRETDPVQKEALSLARTQLSILIKNKGKTVKQVTEEKGKPWVDEQVAAIAASEKVQKAARQRIKERDTGVEALDIDI